VSCDVNGRRCSSAARRNGITGYASRYLNTVASWDTYQDVGRIEDIPARIVDVTSRFFGLVDGRIKGAFGLLIATHLVEQLTGAVATMAARTTLRGKPFGRYRGITLRESPVSPVVGRVQNVYLRGRVLETKGFYFHESGRTWHSHTATYRVGDTPKTLTHIQSLSFPNREFFFDRELPPQDVVDLALGDKDPDTMPGFIGSTNELDGMVGCTKAIKKALYFGNWLLVDETERDAGDEVVDYGGFSGGPGGGGQGPARPYSGGSGSGGGAGSGYGGYRNPAYGGTDWADSYRRFGTQSGAAGRPIGEGYGAGSVPEAGRPADPSAFVGGLWDTSGSGNRKQVIRVDGVERPLSIRSIQVLPDGRRQAEAYYWRNNAWYQVKDEQVREQIAQQVAEGLLQTDDADVWATR
jgi:hypothetical protein